MKLSKFILLILLNNSYAIGIVNIFKNKTLSYVYYAYGSYIKLLPIFVVK